MFKGVWFKPALVSMKYAYPSTLLRELIVTAVHTVFDSTVLLIQLKLSLKLVTHLAKRLKRSPRHGRSKKKTQMLPNSKMNGDTSITKNKHKPNLKRFQPLHRQNAIKIAL